MQNKLSTCTCVAYLVLKQNRKSVMNTTNWPEGEKDQTARSHLVSINNYR